MLRLLSFDCPADTIEYDNARRRPLPVRFLPNFRNEVITMIIEEFEHAELMNATEAKKYRLYVMKWDTHYH